MEGTAARVVACSLDVLRAGEQTLTLQSAADATGITKPGLMHHFPTKNALVRAVVDAVVSHWEARLAALLGPDPRVVPARDRIVAFVHVLLNSHSDRAELAVLTEVHLRDALADAWNHRLMPWLDVSEEPDPAIRGRLITARLAADGYWLASAGGVLPLTEAETTDFRRALSELLSGLTTRDISRPEGVRT